MTIFVIYLMIRFCNKKVMIVYRRYLKRGFYKPFSMIYNSSATLVPGFREAMLNMNVGDKARVFIPSFLGYGARGRAPRIPPNTNLVFDIEIVGIDK